MIYKKRWDSKRLNEEGQRYYQYTGYFLLGFIPLYIVRSDWWLWTVPKARNI